MVETAALKEWSLALRSLSEGRQIILVRKGGIVEETDVFEVFSRTFILLPTFYHQDPEILKPEFRDWLKDDDAPGARIPIRLYAELTDVVPLLDPDTLDRLASKHVWTTAYLKDRFYWKPEVPLSLLLLRVFRLNTPQDICSLPDYGGCRSWVTLSDSVDVSERTPIMDDFLFERERAGILDAVSNTAG